MPVTTATYSAHPDKNSSLLEDREKQFTLDVDVLISVTSHFHKPFHQGLSKYGHPMAMMYVKSLCIWVLFVHVKISVTHSSQACQMVRKLGKCNVSTSSCFAPGVTTSDTTAPSSCLISAVQIQICEWL